MKADLHCHSYCSDGNLSPADLVRRAAANGVTLLALTDHDELAGLDEAAETAATAGIRFVPGVEISTGFGSGESIHIVGLDIDRHNDALDRGLTRIRKGRIDRAERMAAALAWLNIGDALEGARRFARNPELVSRAHFARFLVAKGVMPDVKTVFQHYLVPGKPGYVDHEWIPVAEAVGWIRDAGGVAVLAHPGRYRRLSGERMTQLVDAFVEAGGEAIEVVSSAHSPEDIRRYATLARNRGLLASCGSDFHCEGESPVDVGGCAMLPPDLVSVWSRFG